MTKKGVGAINKKLNQEGGIVSPYSYRRRNWPNSLGRNVDKIYF